VLNNPSFTPLERAVLGAVCERHAADRTALESQLGAAVVVRRENTGAGFYTRFEIRAGKSPAVAGERMRSGPNARVEGLEHGMGFILWLENGFATTLEGYSFGESTSAVSLDTTQFDLGEHGTA